MNDALKYSEARRLAMDLANFYRENIYPLPLELDFPGLRVHVAAEQITKVDDTQPVRTVRDVTVCTCPRCETQATDEDDGISD